jgi:phage-related protein
MSDSTYPALRLVADKPLAWLRGEVKTPPFSRAAEADHNWRLVHRVDPDAIVIAAVFDKKTQQAPRDVIARCQRRLRAYDAAAHERETK